MSGIFVTKVIGFIITFILSVLLIRLLGSMGNGIYVFLETNANLLVAILGFHLVFTLTYFIAAKTIPNHQVLNAVLIINLFSTIIIGIVLVLSYHKKLYLDKLLFLNSTDYLEQHFLLFVLFLKLLFSNTARGYWQGTKNFNLINLFTLLDPIFLLIPICFLTFIPNSPPTFQLLFSTLTVALGLSIIIKAAFFWHSAKKDLKFGIPNRSHLSTLIKYSGILYLTAVVSFFLRRVDFWILKEYTATSDIGNYGLALSLSDKILTIIIPVLHVISPFLTQNESSRDILFTKFCRIITFLMLITIIIVVILMPFFIPLFFGLDFSKAILSTQILVLGSFFLILRDIIMVYFKATNRPFAVLKTMVLSLTILICIELAIIPSMGIEGAAIASLITYIISFGIIFFYFKKQTKISIHKLLIIRKNDLVYIKGILYGYLSSKHNK